MAKSFPVIEVKCDACPAVTSLSIEYKDEQARWHTADTVYFPDEHKGWQIGKSKGDPDYCPAHKN